MEDTTVLAKIYSHLVPRGYFGLLRQIINTRVPPIIEECSRPPTPLAEQIFYMVLNPLVAVAHSKVCMVIRAEQKFN